MRASFLNLPIVPLLCIVPFAAACDQSSPGGPGATQASLEPGQAYDCGAVFADCLAAGVDELTCKDKYASCERANAEAGAAASTDDGGGTAPAYDPWTQCKADFQACADAGYADDLCLEKIRWCAGVCDATANDPGPAPDGDPCMPVYDECVKAGADPVACKERYNACAGWGTTPTDPVDPGPGDPCMPIYDECVRAGGDQVACKERYSACWDSTATPTPTDPGPGDPCMPIYDDCVKAGGDPVACKERYQACWDATWGGQDGQPDGSTDGDVPPPPAGNGCEVLLDECMRAGVDPVACKERFESCLGVGATDPGAGDPNDGGAAPPDGRSPCEIGYQACASVATSDLDQRACLAALEACKAALVEIQ